MIRMFFLFAALAAPAGLTAQYQLAPGNPSAPQNGTVVVPAANIYVVAGGLYGAGVYVVPPAVAAPESASTVGISLAGRAGISLGQPVELGTRVTAPAPMTVYGGYGYTGAISGYSPSAPAVIESEERIEDLGPSYFVESGPKPNAAPTLSLGEVAAQYRANRPQSVRTFTNADAQRLANKVTIAGVSTTESAPPAAEPPITQSRPETPGTSQPQASQETTEAANAAPPPVSRERPSPETATSRLPATSTLLPLLGLLGLLSSGLGLWVRRFFR